MTKHNNLPPSDVGDVQTLSNLAVVTSVIIKFAIKEPIKNRMNATIIDKYNELICAFLFML